jgi:hypothetical protein
MEDDSTIKKVGITKLNGSNYRIWTAITRAVIEAKDTWDTIEQPAPEAKMSEKSTDNRIVKEKAVVTSKTDRVMDTKARTVIMGYYGQEALSKILYLRTAKE